MRFAVGAACLSAIGLSACSGQSRTSSTTTPTPSVVSLAVTGSSPAVGATSQLSATATLSGGGTQVVTSQAVWSSSSASIATVSAAGVISAVSAGEVDVTATYQGVTGRLHLTIAAPARASYTITGTITDGTSGGVLPNIHVRAVDSVGSTIDATSGAAGTYAVPGVAAGALTLTVSAVSYETKRLTVNVSADAAVDIVLQRTSCVLTVSPTAFSFPSGGGTGTVTVASSSTGCAWSAKSNDSFVTITGGASGQDAGAVTFSVGSTVSARNGTLTIAAQTVTISQTGAVAAAIVTGSYDAAFHTASCRDIGSGCSSGTLLAGSGATEINQPNTIASACTDGSGAGHAAVVDDLQIRTGDGTAFAAGKFVIVEATVRLTVPSARVRLFIATDASAPTWIASGDFDVPAGWSGNRIALGGFDWPSGGGIMQAVRVAFSATAQFAGTCASGANDDTDDLVFRVR